MAWSLDRYVVYGLVISANVLHETIYQSECHDPDCRVYSVTYATLSQSGGAPLGAGGSGTRPLIRDNYCSCLTS